MRRGRVLAAVLAGVLAVSSVVGNVSLTGYAAAETDLTAVDVQTPQNIFPVEGTGGNNVAQSDYRWYYWNGAVKSYAAEEEDGTLMTVEYVSSSGQVVIDRYSGAYGLQEEITLETELPIFGGFYKGADNYYLVFAQSNPDELDSREILRVVQYAKDWTRLSACSIYGANTYIPLDAGTLRMTETGGKLYVHTCHEMYASKDGLHHQANMTYVIEESTMRVADSWYEVMNISYGYVSHSFNQFIQTDGTYMYRVDHGDAYPRSVVLTRSSVDGSIASCRYTDLLAIQGATGANYTGVTVGGFELSSDHALVLGTSVDQSDKETYSPSGQQNVFLTVTDKNLSATRTIWLTKYAEDDYIMPYKTRLVKVNDGRFLVFWETYSTDSRRTMLNVVAVDGDGNALSEVKKAAFRLSDGQPIVRKDGSIVWFTTENGSKTLYVIDAYDLSFQKVEQQVSVTASYTKRYGDADFTLNARSEGDGILTYMSSDPDVVTVDPNGQVHIVGAGEATVTVWASETEYYLAGTASTVITVNPQIFSTYFGFALETEGTYSYTGDAIIPAVRVTKNDTELEQGVDYTVSASNNINAGNYARVTVTGTGNYTGTLSGYFTIQKAPQELSGTDAYVKSYGDVAFQLDVEASGGGRLSYTSDNTAVADVDYMGNVTLRQVGTANISVQAAETYNYLESESKTISITVNRKSLADEDVTCSVEGTYTYNGSAIRPAVTVKRGATVLEENVDYTLEVEENINAGGNAVVTATGTGNYTGTLSCNFTIEKAPQELTGTIAYEKCYGDAAFKLDMTAKGGELTYESSDASVVTVSADGTVTITGVGTADITVTAGETANYLVSESRTVSVTVSQKSLADAEVTCQVNGGYVYTGSAIEPEAEVKLGTTVLEEDVDYTLEFSNNINAGTEAKVTVTGIGNYTGSLEVYFTIEKADQTLTGTESYRKREGDASFKLDIRTDGDGALAYESSDPAVAAVSADGTVTIVGAGSAVITVSAEETGNYNAAEKKVEITVAEKEVLPEPVPGILYGDVNADGTVDAKDAALLRRAVAGWDVTIDKAAADVDADGTIGPKDAALLRRAVAGWEVKLGA